jgi:hypothetical protein
MTINSLYDIDDKFSYWNFNRSKKIHIKIIAIVIRKEGIYYEIEGDDWEDEISEENIKDLHYEDSNTRTSF